MSPLVVDLSPRHTCPSVTLHRLRRYLAGELSVQQRQEIDQHIEDCLDCASLLAELRSDQAAFQAVMPFERFAADFEARQKKHRSLGALLDRFRLPVVAGALAAAAAMLLLSIQPSPSSTLRSKGSKAAIGFLIKDVEGVRRGSEGEPLRAGDQIQFLVRPAAGSRSMVLLGIDGRGAVTVYGAERITHRPKGEGSLQPLSGSIILDDAVGAERFFAVFSDSDDAERLHNQVQAAALELARRKVDVASVEQLPIKDDGIVQTSISIVKVKR